MIEWFMCIICGVEYLPGTVENGKCGICNGRAPSDA